MPKAFEECVKKGGKVRRVKPNKTTYMAVCFKDGKSYAGETHKVQKRKGHMRHR